MRFNLQFCPSVLSFVFAVLLLPSFNVWTVIFMFYSTWWQFLLYELIINFVTQLLKMNEVVTLWAQVSLLHGFGVNKATTRHTSGVNDFVNAKSHARGVEGLGF